MNKKVYFIVSSVIQIIIGIYTIIISGSILQNELEALRELYEMLPTQIISDMIETIESSGRNSIIVSSIIVILINIAIIFTAHKNTILRNKALLIVANVVCFLFAGSELAELLAVINIIVLLCLKRVNPEDFPIKRELPKLERIAMTKKETFIGLVLVIIYFSQFIWESYIPNSGVTKWIIILGFYLVVLALSIAFWNKSIKRDLKTFKDNFMTYIRFILPKLGIMYLIYFIVNVVTIIVTQDLSTANQQNLESLPSWYVIPLAIIYAPIVEETIFRGIIHKLIKNKVAFVIVSAICFGLLHTISSEVTLMNIIVKALPYSVLGAFLAYVYAKTENISTNMFCHAAINTLASLITLV